MKMERNDDHSTAFVFCFKPLGSSYCAGEIRSLWPQPNEELKIYHGGC